MATLDQFLEKALDEGQLVGDKVDEVKKQKYKGYVKFEIELTGVRDNGAAMTRAERFINDVEKKFPLFKPSGQVDGVDEM